MTDKEIIKALEEHIARSKYIKYGAIKRTLVNIELLKNAIDLIKRQQEEIEELQRTIRHYAIDEDSYLLPFETEYEAKLNREIIVEFIEKLEFKLRNASRWDVIRGKVIRKNYKNFGFSYDTVMLYISNIVREMVGDGNV